MPQSRLLDPHSVGHLLAPPTLREWWPPSTSQLVRAAGGPLLPPSALWDSQARRDASTPNRASGFLCSIWWAPSTPERASGFLARAESSASAVLSGPCHPRRSVPRPVDMQCWKSVAFFQVAVVRHPLSSAAISRGNRSASILLENHYMAHGGRTLAEMAKRSQVLVECSEQRQ